MTAEFESTEPEATNYIADVSKAESLFGTMQEMGIEVAFAHLWIRALLTLKMLDSVGKTSQRSDLGGKFWLRFRSSVLAGVCIITFTEL